MNYHLLGKMANKLAEQGQKTKRVYFHPVLPDFTPLI